MKNFKRATIIGLMLMVVSFMPSMGRAETCTVAVENVPDPFLTGDTSTTCGLGDSNTANASDAGLDSVIGSFNWVLIDKDGESPDLTSTNEGALVFSPHNGTTGTWSVDIDALGATYDTLVLVLKDGPTGTPPPNDDPQWVWFILQEQGTACVSGIELCGTWTMWGNNNNINNTELHQISHMELWGTNRDNGPGPFETPEPSTLLLLGSGLVAVSRFSRRRQRQK